MHRCILPVSSPVGFTSMAVINPLERKLPKRTSVEWFELLDPAAQSTLGEQQWDLLVSEPSVGFQIKSFNKKNQGRKDQ